ncbi:MAG: hypothetical protein Q7S84_02705 [bacterium]|nr:hypothetical protein [bacterium]
MLSKKVRHILATSDLHPHEQQHARWLYETMKSIALLHALPKYGAGMLVAIVLIVQGVPATRTAAFDTCLLALGIFIAAWVIGGLVLAWLRNKEVANLEHMLTEPAKRKRIPKIVVALHRADPKTVLLVQKMDSKLKKLLQGEVKR